MTDTLAIERKVIRKLLRALTTAGFDTVKVVDEEGEVVKVPLAKTEAVMRELFATEVEWLKVYRGREVFQVFLVHGNGASVISDYSMGLDDLLSPVLDYANTFDN